ncbi:hypothetical protein V5799_016281 [Amblyomma americanum]|uniref:Cystatin domain-containing protein n=1 Tax=Amblyomma americanum TaxID=6943 RepID=A0AAQ4F6R1_AMBAM
MKITSSLLVVVAALVVGVGTGAAASKKGSITGGIVKQPKSRFHYYQSYADELAREMSMEAKNRLIVLRITEVKTQIVAGKFIWIKIRVTESDCTPGTKQSECVPLLCAPFYTCKAKIFEDWTQTKFLSKHCNFHDGVKGQRKRC